MAFFGGAPAAGGPPPGSNAPSAAPNPSGTASGGGFSRTANTPAAPTPAAGNSGAAAAPSTNAAFNFTGNAPAVPPAAAAPFSSGPGSTGVGFGGSAASSTMPSAPAGAPTPAPATAFSFSSAPSAPPASAPTTSAPGASTSDPVAATVPEYVSLFPNMRILDKLDALLPEASEHQPDNGGLAAQELYHVLDCTSGQDPAKVFGAYLARPEALEWKQRDAAFRDRLKNNPKVLLHGQTAALTPPMLEEVFKLSDELGISEVDALSLYAEANVPETRLRLQDRLEYSFVDNAVTGSVSPLFLGNDVYRSSLELFFYERSCAVKAILKLIQFRLELNAGVLAASDQLLVANLLPNLVKLIGAWTARTDTLEQELTNVTRTRPSQTNVFGLQQSVADETTRKCKMHLKFGYSQRQMVAESLFFLTYHTQCTPDEVGALIDVIKELTNGSQQATSGLPLLDPFSDVPDAYHDPVMPNVANNQFATLPQHGLPHLRAEKDPVEWEHELVDLVWASSGGKPQLLQCVSTLVLTTVCALDSRTELIDRNTHSVNSFGTGNALFPPQSNDTHQLLPVHTRLDPNGTAIADWKRSDIWGLLVASYALLLRSLPAVANSPRVGSSTTSSPSLHGPVDVKKTWRSCMNTPTQEKAFSCARLCLMPSLERHKDKLSAKCDTYEFSMSVLSDFVSHFVDVLCASGDIPLSRQQWESNLESELNLRHRQQEQQRDFLVWSRTNASTNEEAIPNSVDLMSRPDCFDDVIALATALCSTGPSYATRFWAISEEEVDGTMRKILTPSRALRKAKHQLDTDRSLLPIYVSFLASLALAPSPCDNADSGAAVVNNVLSRASSESERTRVDWLSIMNVIRWYARELRPGSATTSATEATRSSSPGLSGHTSTAYYYGVEDSGMDGSAGYTSSQQATSNGSSSTGPKSRDMGETNTNILLSHLDLISTVASKSASARSVLVAMKIPVASQDSSSFAGDDPLLTVLFLLSISPLTPMLRGAVFSTIASLLKVDGAGFEEKKIIQEQAMKGWDLLDSCRVLPISQLDQYETLPQGAAQIYEGLAFPPSSISLVSKDTKGAWLPPERTYGIVFEMEQVESRTGQYPSTEGFLELLTSLFVSAGSPADLGAHARVRPGCTPYIEYVSNFVLPRALLIKKDSIPLPFRTASDKFRLITRGLEVIESVLVRYAVPAPAATSPVPLLVSEKRNQNVATSEDSVMMRLPSLVENIVVTPIERDVADYALDYLDTAVSREAFSGIQPPSAGSGLASVDPFKTEQAPFPGGEPPVPRAKSPGFTILTELLSTSAGLLFAAMVKVLTEDEVARGIRHVCGLDEYGFLETQALFGQTPPTVSSARAKSNGTSSRISRQALLEPLIPQLKACSGDRQDAISWRETSIVHTLRILCAAAAREEAFYKAVSASQSVLKIVPALRFLRRTMPPSGVVDRNVQVSRLVNLLVSFARTLGDGGGYVEAPPAIVEYVEYDASTLEHDAYISNPAVALTFYVGQSLGTNESIRILSGSRAGGFSRLAKAFGRRLLRSFKLAIARPDNDVAALILDSILTTFRGGCSRETSISHVILGLPFLAGEGNWIGGTYDKAFRHSSTGGVTRDCFDAVLECLSDARFVTDSSSSHLAAGCFEVIYRMTEVPPDNPSDASRRISYAANRLRLAEFWRTKLMLFLAIPSNGAECLLRQVASLNDEYRPRGIDNCLQSIAWLLKSVTTELLALDLSHAGSTSGQRRLLLSLLFTSSYQLCLSLLQSMPISSDGVAYIGNEGTPSRATLEASRVPMRGAPEVVAGYTCVDKTTIAQISPQNVVQEQWKWAEKWNKWVAWDCASSHLSVAALFLIESAVISSHPPTDATMGSTATTMLEIATPVDILHVILLRIVGREEEETGLSTMDDVIISGVSSNLSRIVLLLAEQLSFRKKETPETSNITTEASAVEICRLLVHAVLSSSYADQGRPLLPHEKLRTATFGLALSIMMKSNPDANLLDGLAEEFLGAAIAIGRLVCSGATSSRNEAIDGQRAIQLAQVAFCCTLGFYRDEGNPTLVRLMSAPSDPGATRTLIQAVVSLISDLDGQIFRVVERIIACKDGPELLVESQLPRALRHAANDYVSQERKVLQDTRYGNAALGVPAFLQGHASLMKSFLLSPTLPPRRRHQVAAEVLDVLLAYTDVVGRMVGLFPKTGQVLIDILQCLVLATGHDHDAMQKFASDERSSLWNRNILQLSYVLSQNPFPLQYLPALPMKLSDGSRTSVAGNVSISDANTHGTWWDAVDQSTPTRNFEDDILLPVPPSGRSQDSGWSGMPSPVGGTNGGAWTASKYLTALEGANALDTCLAYLESLSEARALHIDGYALARGLCRCSDVAKGAHFRLVTLNRDVADSNAMGVIWSDPAKRRESIKLERDFICKLGASMQRCTEKLLVILSLHLRTLRQAFDNERTSETRFELTEFSRCTSAALDYTRLDATANIDGNDVVLHIGKNLRDELKKA